MDFVLFETNLNADGFIAVTKETVEETHIPPSVLPCGIPPVVRSLDGQAEDYLNKYLEDQSIYSVDAPVRLAIMNFIVVF